MRTVITYGTFDLFHNGHRRLLERARDLGDRLIVGVTSDAYDRTRGKLNVQQTVTERIENIKQTGLADQIIVEEYAGQKIHDIQQWGVDIFAIGSDWVGQFDYLNDYCKVVYLERTRGVSSTQLRNDQTGILRMGLVGATEKAWDLVKEARFVSGISVEAVWDERLDAAQDLANQLELQWVNETYDHLLKHVDAVYISTGIEVRPEHIRKALEAGVHVLSAVPLSLTERQSSSLTELARNRKLALVEAIRTAYAPGFLRLVAYARSNSIGRIRSVKVTSTKAAETLSRYRNQDSSYFLDLVVYSVLPIIKLLGSDYEEVTSWRYANKGPHEEDFVKINLIYKNAVASVTAGVGIQAENHLEIAGTSGSIYVPAPWWRTQYFEARYPTPSQNEMFFDKYEGTGQRYELLELIACVTRQGNSFKVSESDTNHIAQILENISETAPLQEIITHI